MKILIIDDDAILQRLYSHILEAAGHTVVSGSDGSQVLLQALNEKPDVILMDVVMTYMDGIAALKQLKENETLTHIPVVLISAIEDQALAKQAKEAGAADFIIKASIDDSEIVSRVEAAAQAAR